MKYSLAGSIMGAAMLAATVLPQPAAAARGFVTMRAQELQNAQLTTVSPGDKDAQEFLALLNISLQATDPIWNDPTFAAMISKYKEIRVESLNVISDVGEIALDAFDLADLASRVDHDSFRSQFHMTESDRMDMESMRIELEKQLAEFKQNPDAVLSELLNKVPSGDFNFEDDYMQHGDQNGLTAYGYADPYEPVQAGRIVWLKDASYDSTGADWTAEWTQTDGPEVSWLSTDSDHDRAFIVPSYEDTGLTYLTFELTVTNAQGESATSYVYVDLDQGQSDVEKLFEEVVGQQPSDEDLTYWQSKYDQGMSLDEIRKHFELFADMGL